MKIRYNFTVGAKTQNISNCSSGHVNSQIISPPKNYDVISVHCCERRRYRVCGGRGWRRRIAVINFELRNGNYKHIQRHLKLDKWTDTLTMFLSNLTRYQDIKYCADWQPKPDTWHAWQKRARDEMCDVTTIHHSTLTQLVYLQTNQFLFSIYFCTCSRSKIQSDWPTSNKTSSAGCWIWVKFGNRL